MKKSNLFLKFFMATMLTMSLSGCDMVASVKDHFNKDKKQNNVQAKAPQVVKQQVPPQAQQPPKQVQPPKIAAKPQPKVMPKPKVATKPKPLSGNQLARVGTWTITKEEFEERLGALKEVVPEFDSTTLQAKQLILDELIRQQLLVEQAEKSGEAKDKDIVAAVEEFRRTLIVREMARKLTEDVEVTDEDAKAFYEENKDKIIEPTEYKVREIVLKDQVKANEILVDVLKGSDFAEIAKLNSTSKSASKGGDLGFLTQEPFPEMGREILALKEGDVSNVFQGPDGYYIVKLEKIKGGIPIPFDEVKSEIIRSQTLIKQQQAIVDYIDKIKETIHVEVREELLN